MLDSSSPTLLIIYEHDDFVVVNKPVGVAMHDHQFGIVALMRQQYPQHAWHLVHRLDTETSGCLLLAKDNTAAAKLSELFARRSIEKYYLCRNHKPPEKKQGLIKGDMQKARRGDLELVNTFDHPAITQYFSKSIAPSLRLFICKPHTGKTHQIRVALKSQGAPILGDSRYGSSTSTRMHLYSFALRFEYASQLYEISYADSAQDLIDWQNIPQSWLRPWELAWPKI